MAKPKILITGATGFVGSYLIPRLSDKFDIDLVIRNTSDTCALQQSIVNLITWDELDEHQLRYDAIIHMAGLAHDTSNSNNLDKYMEVNLGLTKKIARYSERTSSHKLIFLSSIKACGEQNGILHEELPSQPMDPYGVSKKAAEDFLLSECKSSCFVLRPSLIYGPNSKGNLEKLAKLIDRGIPYPFKSVENKRTMLFIGNLCAVMDELASNDHKPGIYHIADDNHVSTADLFRWIATARNKRAKLFSLPRFCVNFFQNSKLMSRSSIARMLNKMLGNLEVSNQKILAELGWNKMPYSTEESMVESFKI